MITLEFLAVLPKGDSLAPLDIVGLH